MCILYYADINILDNRIISKILTNLIKLLFYKTYLLLYNAKNPMEGELILINNKLYTHPNSKF